MLDGFDGRYRGRRVLVTGHTGFKGSWLSIWLRELGAEVAGFSLEPKTERDNYVLAGLDEKLDSTIGDIRELRDIQRVIARFKPNIIFHLAAQPLVRLAYEEPLETLDTNIMGTANLLEAVRHAPSVDTVVVITSDKCYANKELRRGYEETDELGGYDPYSASKGAAELIVSCFRDSYFNPAQHKSHGKAVASARAGNVIGGGDWSRDRIVPDCIRHLEAGEAVQIRNPGAVRPWQHVLEPVGGYLLLGQRMMEEPTGFCTPWNFGPPVDSLITVGELTSKFIDNYGSGSWTDASRPNAEHETGYLALDWTKARKELAWNPRLDIDATVRLTADWYKRFANESDVYALAVEQIGQYVGD